MQPQVLTYFQPSAEVHSISDLIALRTDPPTDTELFTFIYLIHCVCGGWMFMCQCTCVVYVHVPVHMCGDERTVCWSQFSSSAMWVQRIKLRPPGLATCAFCLLRHLTNPCLTF